MALFVRLLADNQEHWAVNPGTFLVGLRQIRFSKVRTSI